MFVGFNVEIDEAEEIHKFYPYYDAGLKLYESLGDSVIKELEEYINPDGSLSEKKIEDNWFPDVEAHVFLSHAHRDEKYVISFAGWLYKKFGIKSFIDSCMWHYVDDLLKNIDIKYCVSSRYPSGKIKAYSYSLRNISTSNVHMILSTALMKMIDNTECLMFMNTPYSVKWSDISGNLATRSPWIYNELLFSKLVRNRSRKAHRDRFEKSYILEHRKVDDFPNIEYVIDVKHLIKVSYSDFDLLLDSVNYDKSKGMKRDVYSILDEFYEISGIDLEEGKLRTTF